MKIAIEALLQPITPEAPCGKDLSFSPEFDAIQEARREEDASLDQGEWVRDIKEADWPAVIEQSSAVLQTRSKDIRVAAWLVEALGKVDGCSGLADGLMLMEQLVEQYWPQLHPLPDGDDFEDRTGSLTWLLQRAEALMRSTPLCKAPTGAYSWADHESAQVLQTQMDRNPGEANSIAADHLNLTQFRAACRATPKPFYETLFADFGRLREVAKGFEQAIDARLGADGPSFASFRQAIEDVGSLVERLARDAGVLAARKDMVEEQTPADQPADTGAASGAALGPIRSRAQALRQLRLVAEFFRQTEPHSPVAYLADKAAVWGEMPLHIWLKHVIKDGGALSRLEEMLGTESASRDASPE
jgi:type VI secretion system protein ImpA